jgi:hypothetical protein
MTRTETHRIQFEIAKDTHVEAEHGRPGVWIHQGGGAMWINADHLEDVAHALQVIRAYLQEAKP